jgi:hypothetical protein
MPPQASDHSALLGTAAVSCPVAAGLLWVGATALDSSVAVAAAVFLVAWLVISLPVAMLIGRFIARHITGLEEEDDR